MKKDEVVSNILGCSVSGYYKWKKQGRYIIDLLDKYFSKSDLEEYLETGKVSKFELLNDFNDILYGSKLDYLEFISNNLVHSIQYDTFTDFYYKLLVYISDLQKSYSVDIAKVWSISDAIPGFFVNNGFLHEENILNSFSFINKVHTLNEFDQNLNNFIRLGLSRNFKPLIDDQDHIRISRDYKKNAIVHALLFTIYSRYPELSYFDKRKKLLDIFGINIEIRGQEEEVFQIGLDNQWMFAEIDFEAYLRKI